MAAIKTINFLPEVFQTDTNKKFLNATLDQLVSEPNFKKVNGYIGRKFAPTYKTSDSYVNETDTDRQNYQLEPSTVVFNPETNTTDFYSSYVDLINKIKFYGGNTTDHSRLFRNQTYSYDGHFDLDKFVNFSQYYWLANGPDAVSVTASGVPTEYTWTVTADPVTGAYQFTSAANAKDNPTLTLARGGKYTFNIESGSFWIQSAPGIAGTDPNHPNVNTRDVLGVTNNGASSGSVVFTVPQPNGQARYTNMPLSQAVDFATSLNYSDIQGATTDQLAALGGFDGVASNPLGKKIIFVGPGIDDYYWTVPSNINPTTKQPIDPLLVVPSSDRTKTWIVQVDQSTNVITLVAYDTINKNERVYVKSGAKNAAIEFYLDYTSTYKPVPLLTASLSSLYYQNSQNGSANGAFILVDPADATIDPAANIIGKKSYTSPNGITFTNGLKVTFDSTAGTAYDSKEFYVEGVGTSIRLVPVTDLVTPELLDLSKQDYLTINRSSLDLNAWSRSNRWFHIEVLQQTALYNNTELLLDQATRASRPIIEFNSDIRLYNYGEVAKSPINILDSLVTNAYLQIESKAATNSTSLTISIDGASLTLHDGDTVVFSSDANPAVRSSVYIFNVVDISENIFTHQYICTITPVSGSEFSAGNNVLVIGGINSGKEFWYDGNSWNLSQQKSTVNQAPLFDMFDSNGISFGDASTYVNSSFNGTKLFSYRVGTGNSDVVLGFPLSYRTFNNVGDIQFDNNFDQDTFSYLVSPITLTKSINTGYLHITNSIGNYAEANIWLPTNELSKQYQIISHTADGTNNLFEIDILPNPSTSLPNVKVLVNSKFIDINNFGLTQIGVRYAVLINPLLLTTGDSIDILIFSDSVSKMGYYQIPTNLDNNALNNNFDSLTLGQLRNHLVTIAENSQQVLGMVPGQSNLRDINIMSQGGNILKHAAPAVYSNLFLVDNKINFIEGIRLATKEYSKFKNKILELSTKSPIDTNDISGSLDNILSMVNGVKNSSFPWYYSDMLPWGSNKTVLPLYTVLDPRIREYELSTIFDDTTLSNKAVLIYLTRTVDNVTTKSLLVKDRDYTFNKNNPGFTINADFNLNYDDVLTVVEYHDTDGNYVPETPSKMGMWPKHYPEIVISDTYSSNGPITVIQGHDGSVTPAFGDYRDDLLLEFERRIYNNIKQDLSPAIVDVGRYFPGKFRVTDYTLDEFNQVLSSTFLTWIGNNRLDYSTNSHFQSNNPWTWNYKYFRDTVTGDFLQGTWHAVFDYFYDTQTPHTTPWEMLGFINKPDYWDARYGAAPYTGGNMLLWTDLSLGYIAGYDRSGATPGIYSQFARPGLLNIIPVDDAGNLRPPNEFLVRDFDSSRANASYAIGDFGPAENAWRNSSEFPFALMTTLSLVKPALFFSEFSNINTYNFNYSLNQFLVDGVNRHLTPTDIEVNGYTENGVIYRTSGYVNWISDYLKNQGYADPQSTIKQYLKDLNVQLSYRTAGFTDKRYIKILAEQGSPSSTNDSIIIPDENYRIELTKSVPIEKIAYSAVIVERTQGGYTVSGYNLSTPYFTIIPSLASNNAYSITTGKLTTVVYRDYQKVRVRVPYGFEFGTVQEVVDFLVSYQRQLQSQGFIFTDFDTDLKTKQDWVLSAKEFMTWTMQGWATGNVIILSPVNQSLSVVTTNSVVDEITNLPTGSKLLDPNFAVITSNNFSVLREDNTFKVSSIKGQTITFAELHLVQYEHVIIFSNKTSFNDVIYSPETGNRQYRLKFIGSKTANWTGALNPPGFIYNSNNVDAWQPGHDYKKGDLVAYKNTYYVALDKIVANELFNVKYWKQVNQSSIKTGLLPNFATNASKFANIYDIDNQPADETIGFYSNGMVGFRERSYLTDLALDIDTQSKFYQGYIKQKGTKSAILALARAQLANISNEVNIYEEWALRVGEYGATDVNRYVEIILDEAVITDNPAPIQFIDNGIEPIENITTIHQMDWYQATLNNTSNMFDVYTSSSDHLVLPVAGYVNISDVDDTIFDIANYSELGNIINNIGTGYTIWAAKGFVHGSEWDVYRVGPTKCLVTSMSYSIDNIATLTMSNAHNLSIGDIVAVKNFDNRFNGFYQVYTIPDSNQITVGLRQNYALLSQLKSVSGNGILFKLSTARINTPSDVDSVTPMYGWGENDKVWVDDLDGAGNWGVYSKTSPWAYSNTVSLNASEYQGFDNFGQSLKLSSNGKIMFTGAPSGGTGRVALFLKTADGSWLENSNFVNNSTGTTGFGAVIDASDVSVIVSAPTSQGNTGYVFIYSIDTAGVSLSQVITVTTGTADDLFGSSVSVNSDGNWVYIGAPGAGKVYAYGRQVTTSSIQTVSASGSNNDFTLTDQTVTDASDILVTGAVPYIPNIDYIIYNDSGTYKLRFIDSVGSATPPAAGSILVTYHTHYKLLDTWTQTEGFGASVKTNAKGDQIVVGSYNEAVGNVVQAGKAYVYDRMIEGFISTGNNNTFIPTRPIGPIFRVTIDGIVKVQGVDFNLIGNNIQFITPPLAGSQIDIEVNVEINTFNLIQVLSSASPSDRQQMGRSIDLSPSGDVLVGATQYATHSYTSGAVYRFTNQGRKYGIITSNVYEPTVTVGHSIRINRVEVTFTESSLDHVVNKINGSGVAGISAVNNNGYLQITSTRNVPNYKLDILPGTGTALTDLGLLVFAETQKILHPGNNTEVFGAVISSNDAGTSLAISSVGGSIINRTTLDSDSTTFDVASTQFSDQVGNTGMVYIYDLMENPYENVSNPALFAYVQQLNAPHISSNYNFGSAIDIIGDYIAVGASNGSEITPQGGSIYTFASAGMTQGWDLIRYKEPRVDQESIDKIYIYNKTTNTILAKLDYVDPAKGKVLGEAQQDLDFIAEYDPAIYNDGTGIDTGPTNKFNTSFHWSDMQVGKTWWDLSQVRYIDYEQDTLVYRSKHWGQVFNGSVFKVYEWVESPYIPSQYVANGGNGIPKYEDNSSYVSYTQVDSSTGLFNTLYYYWVSDKTTVDVNRTNRTNSVYSLQQMLASPKDQGIPYAAAIATNAINLYNVESYLTGTNTVLHIDYSPRMASSIIHSEYDLVAENSSTGNLPTRIVTKLQDSLAGLDSAGLVVPDPSLGISSQIGIGIRPRQSVFINRLTGLENFVKYVNTVLAKSPVVYTRDLTKLRAGSAYPSAGTGAWAISVDTKSELDYVNKTNLTNGYKILVLNDTDNDGLWAIYSWVSSTQTWFLTQIQSYKTDIYWTTVDWYASDFDYTLTPTYTIDLYQDIEKLNLMAGDTVKLRDNGEGSFVYYRVADNLALDQVGIQNGTIQLSNNLYDLAAGKMAYDNDNFDTIRFDQTPNEEVRHIFDAIHSDIFIDDLAIEFNSLFFSLVNYIFSEQKSTDWIFKTSFIKVMHKIRELIQYPSYVKDNQTFYEDYINEVKPYRTQIREYVPAYNGIDYLHAGATDFDLPSHYDSTTKTYRSPDESITTDSIFLKSTRYIDWYNNHKYSVASIEVADGGTGFTLAPNVTITGGGGTGAVAYAEINALYGNISSVTIVNPGSGYTSTPTITVNGNGTGAALVSTLHNVFYSPSPADSYNTVRTFNTEMKFDRVGFRANVVDWTANTAYTANITVGNGTGNIWLHDGNLVSYNNKLYYPVSAVSTSETTFDSSLYNVVDPANVLVKANERVMGLYTPGVGMPARDLATLVGGVEYPGVKLQGMDFANTQAVYMDSTISSTYLDTALGTRPEDINVDGGAYVDRFSSHAPEELMPGRMYDALDMKVFTKVSGNTVILGHRVFYSMTGNVDYTRIADAYTTTLSANLNLTDSNVQVTDASILPEPNPEMGIPGVVFINGEKITYYSRDTENNVIGQLRRGVDGTGAATVHASGSLVVDSSIQQSIQGNVHTDTWLNMTANVADGTGFEGSTTSEVLFLKASPSYAQEAVVQSIFVDDNGNIIVDNYGNPLWSQ